MSDGRYKEYPTGRMRDNEVGVLHGRDQTTRYRGMRRRYLLTHVIRSLRAIPEGVIAEIGETLRRFRDRFSSKEW